MKYISNYILAKEISTNRILGRTFYGSFLRFSKILTISNNYFKILYRYF